jgi:hypothetical protein
MKRQVFLIIKEEVRGPGVPIEDRLSLHKTMSSKEAAEREVERLRRLDAAQPWRYYCQEWTLETPDECEL